MFQYVSAKRIQQDSLAFLCRSLALAALILTIAIGGVAAPARAAAPKCTDLVTNPAFGLAGNPAITAASATLVPASTAPAHAAYCNVQITYSSRSGLAFGYATGEAQSIKIGIGLPVNNTDGGSGGMQGAWNGNLENLGGGGCAGNVGATTSATDAGYVGTSTDTGHTSAQNGALCNFGVIQSAHELDLGKINDFIYEAIHQQVEWGKTLARGYYGIGVTRNYWNGCSTGGRQGLAMAQTYGDEFDGFVIGAPAIYWQQFRLSDAWPYLVVKDDLTPKGKTLTLDQFNAANTAAIAACDAKDGVVDGLVDDPRACTFSAKANICGVAGAPGAPNCLDADQAAAIDKIWDGPRNHLGLRIWHPFDRSVPGGVLIGFASMPSSAAQVMAYDHRDLNFDVSLLYTDEAAIAAAGYPAGAITYEGEATLGANNTADFMDTQDPDLSAVRHRGGKIIMWQGASDPLIRWRDSVDYYERVATFFGHGEADYKHLQSWFRYYHAPGVAHCGGGAGPAPADPFGALVNWVEHGVAPDTILAKGGSLNANRTRPLCPWPTTAIYNGTGSTDDASNFHCGGDLDAKPVAACKMLRTKYKHENAGASDASDIDIEPGECPSSGHVALNHRDQDHDFDRGRDDESDRDDR